MKAYTLVGLGNPGEDYQDTRHNVGQMAIAYLKDHTDAKVKYVIPDTYMNDSGGAVKPLIKSAKAAENLVVIHDDLDLPLGTLKISFNRGPGGHNGVRSIQKALKTEAFWRMRIGISPTTPSGKLKKVSGEEKVHDFILGKFKPAEKKELTKIFKKITEAVEFAAEKGMYLAMGQFN